MIANKATKNDSKYIQTKTKYIYLHLFKINLDYIFFKSLNNFTNEKQTYKLFDCLHSKLIDVDVCNMFRFALQYTIYEFMIKYKTLISLCIYESVHLFNCYVILTFISNY